MARSSKPSRIGTSFYKLCVGLFLGSHKAMSEPEFQRFQKISRLRRPVLVSEKIDGTSGCVYVGEDGQVVAGSRNRWLTPQADNFGFARWVADHEAELRKLGPGRHFGEWWGNGIQRNYGLGEKRFSLFNVSRWRVADFAWPSYLGEDRRVEPPGCCHVVPVLGSLEVFNSAFVSGCLEALKRHGSLAAPGFNRPEGIVALHVASNTLFKQTIDNDEEPKARVVLARGKLWATT